MGAQKISLFVFAMRLRYQRMASCVVHSVEFPLQYLGESVFYEGRVLCDSFNPLRVGDSLLVKYR